MYEYNLAYRYTNNDVEGFTGIALSNSENAKSNALQKIRNKIKMIADTTREEKFLESSLILSFDNLSTAEKKQVREDWEISKKSCFC